MRALELWGADLHFKGVILAGMEDFLEEGKPRSWETRGDDLVIVQERGGEHIWMRLRVERNESWLELGMD